MYLAPDSIASFAVSLSKTVPAPRINLSALMCTLKCLITSCALGTVNVSSIAFKPPSIHANAICVASSLVSALTTATTPDAAI